MLRHQHNTTAFTFAAAPLLATQGRFNRGFVSDAAPIKKLENMSEFHNISEAFIEDASIFGDALLDNHGGAVDDVGVSDGVLEIKAPGFGTFVLNKQAPLQQIWYSSPISGPHHYDYDLDKKRWVSDKDRHDLQDKFERELSSVVKKPVSFKKPF